MTEIKPEAALEGTLFAGRYRIEARLGAGGHGEVYLGRHEVLGRRIALKLLHASVQADPKLLARFQREARAASRIRHPNIPHVHDFSYTDAGRPYMVMDHIPGQTLTRVLADGGPMALPRCLDILAQVARALEAAHRVGVLHRDLKPDNIMLVAGAQPGQERAMVLDFGLAKILASGSLDLTTEGSFQGTPEYIPPELIEGKELDHRADLYSLGVVAFEMLAGRPPFEGRLMSVLRGHMEQSPPTPSRASGRADIPRALDGLVLRCLAKEPADRHATAAAAAAELEALLLRQPRK